MPVLTRTVLETVQAARAKLLGLQDESGWWKGKLASNVTMDAEDLLLRHFLGILDAQRLEQSARWIRSQQREDGTWATFYDGPGDLNTTVEAWVALRLAGDPADAPHLLKAQDFIRANGGVHRTRVFTRIWLALVGLWSWDDLPAMPPELILLPKWFPLNVYDWACWARQTVVPLTLVGTLRPSRPVGFGIAEIVTGPRPAARVPRLSWKRFFLGLDKVLHRYHRVAFQPLRKLATRKALRWILERQERDGSWGGIQPPWVYSILALHLNGYPLDHPVLAAGLRGLENFTIREETPDGPIAMLEACQSPIWDTALAAVALLDSPGDAQDALKRAGSWLLSQEITIHGDWAVRRPHLSPGGWAFEFANEHYPDIDDTAEVVLALRRIPGLAAEGAIDRGIAWNAGMQSKDGGWGAFDADNTRKLATYLPFCDFGAVIDPPSADVTAHVVEMFAEAGMSSTPECQRGIQWLLDAQEDDGSWFGRWGANHLYGTGAVVPALVAAGLPTDGPVVRKAVSWLERHQNADGGWGEDLRSYVDPSLVGTGASTPAQTAWALLALLAAGEMSPSVENGVDWLVRNQTDDGTWDEPYFTGTGFPRDFYLAYHLYRLVFPLTALGRYLTAKG